MPWRRPAACGACRQENVEKFFAEEKPEYVFLAAAKVGGIVANQEALADFMWFNMTLEMNVIHSAWQNGCKKLEFLGSSCIYPRMAPQPMKESCLLTSELEKTNEAYALAKISGLKYCEFLNRQYGTDYISVMPTNLYGPNDNYHPTHSHVVPALIRRFHEAKVNGVESVTCWGDGSHRRLPEPPDSRMIFIAFPFSARRASGCSESPHRTGAGRPPARSCRSSRGSLPWRRPAACGACRQENVEKFFAEEKPEYVFLAAAKVGGIVANQEALADFMWFNMTLEMNVIHSAWQNGCKKLEFLGSSCIYPRMAPQPMKESCLLTSELEKTNEAYALAKISGLKYCEFLNRQYGTDYISVMPTNLYGPNDNYHPTHSHVVPALTVSLPE